jgi:hypothetical protein
MQVCSGGILMIRKTQERKKEIWRKEREEREQRLSKVENATDHRMDQIFEFHSSLGYPKDTIGKI